MAHLAITGHILARSCTAGNAGASKVSRDSLYGLMVITALFRVGLENDEGNGSGVSLGSTGGIGNFIGLVRY